MKAMRYIALLCLVAMLLFCAACGGEKAPAPAAEPTPDVDLTGMTVPEAYAAVYGGGDYEALAERLDIEKYNAVIYYIYGEALEEYRAEGADIVSQLYDALAQATVTGPYEGTELRTDSGSYLGFTDEAGEDIGYTFDFGHLSAGGRLYDLADSAALWTVADRIQELSE